MKLTLSRAVYEAMLEAAREVAPIEACGLLGGKDDVATQFYKLTNADADAEHFSMLPAEQFAAIKDMRTRGLRLLAIWHSHPATPPRMSDEDLRLAFTPGVVYVILSLAVRGQEELRGYEVRDGKAADIRVAVEREHSASNNGGISTACRNSAPKEAEKRG